MNTPREILLKRHQPANAGLDVVRRKVIADECAAKTVASPDAHISPVFRCAAKLWHELILPARYAWTGLALVWLVIATTTVVTRDSASVMAKLTSSPQGAQQVLRAQQQLRAELIGPVKPIAADRPKDRPLSPRSEHQIKTALV